MITTRWKRSSRKAFELFRKNGVEYTLIVENGNAEDVIPQKAREGEYIIVLGRLDRWKISMVSKGSFHPVYDGGN